MKNMRRAANRRATTSMVSEYREPSHTEPGFRGGNQSARSYGSPASIGAGMGPGPIPGAGELPGRGPGAAASRYAPRDPSETPVAKTPGPPSGISVYKAGNAPPKGYRQ